MTYGFSVCVALLGRSKITKNGLDINRSVLLLKDNSLIIVQNLRDDATAIRNQKNIKEIIHQRPEVYPQYYFWKIVCHRAKPQSDTFIIRSLVDKVSAAYA